MRMHLTLKTEATRPAAANALQQQTRFDAFLDRFNHERPHQALGTPVPGDLYTRSARPVRRAGAALRSRLLRRRDLSS
jgi:putative transposase